MDNLNGSDEHAGCLCEPEEELCDERNGAEELCTKEKKLEKWKQEVILIRDNVENSLKRARGCN